MKFAFLFISFLFVGCQDYNSNTFDRDRYGKIELIGGPQFEASYKVLQSRCINCHTHAGWAAYTNQADWVNAGLVVPNSADNSKLIYRIKNYGSTSSDMPVGGSSLPADEYTALTTWVTGYTP